MSDPVSDPMSDIVVVGAGLAGFHTASALRRLGHRGAITVLGAEAHAPYDRPPLSKAFLGGSVSAADLALDDPDAPLDVAWERGVGAVGLEPGAAGVPHRVLLADGTERRAHHVVVATGADAVRLGDHVPGAHVLRTLEDAERLRAERLAGARVVVVGDGFVALEAASTVVALGAASVVVAGPEERPLERRYGQQVAASLLALHARRGVAYRGRARAVAVTSGADGRADGVLMADGTRLEADVVVVGIGARPATSWLAGSAVVRDATGHVDCDARGATSVPGVWAVGDCARWNDEVRGPMRCAGHWQDALDHAAAVAAAVTGAAAPAATEPYCWSEQHGVMLQVAGHLVGGEQATVLDGSVDGADLLVRYERDGEEVAVLGMNRPREVTRWRRSRRARPAPTPAPPVPAAAGPARSLEDA